MTDHLLERRQLVPGTIREIFAFFEDPYNLERLTPPWLRFEVREASDPTVKEGTRIEYRLAWQGIPMRWESRITEYRAGAEFVDEMIRGPYARWHHRHLFRPVEGGVEMRDVVSYRLPLGPLGRAVHTVLVRRQLEAIFDYRRTAVTEVFGGEASVPTLARGWAGGDGVGNSPTVDLATRGRLERLGDSRGWGNAGTGTRFLPPESNPATVLAVGRRSYRRIRR